MRCAVLVKTHGPGRTKFTKREQKEQREPQCEPLNDQNTKSAFMNSFKWALCSSTNHSISAHFFPSSVSSWASEY